MATYIPGMTDYIPQVSFHPDLNFYQYVLQTKTAQARQGAQQLQGLYGSLFNSPMLRESDIKRRDDYYKQIQDTMTQISQTDLSRPDNVSAAMKIFQPLLDDQNISSDIAYTKRYQGELTRAEALRNNPKKDSGFWEEGIMDLNNWAEDYSRTGDKDALMFPQARYTPYVDPYAMAMDHIKGMGFKSSGVSFKDFGNGRVYAVTSTNGERMVAPLHDYLMGVVGSDPKVQAVYGVKARLALRSKIDSLRPQMGDAAEDYVLSQLMGTSVANQDRTQASLNKASTAVDATTKKIGDKIEETDGINSDNPLMNSLRELQNEKNAIDKAQQVTSDNSFDPKNMLSMTNLARKQVLSRALAQSLMQGDLFNMARDYSLMTSEVKMEAEPYAKANYENTLKRMDMAIQHKYNMELAVFKKGLDTNASDADNEFRPSEARAGEKGNFGPENSYKLQQELKDQYTSPYNGYMDVVASKVFKQLAYYVDNPTKTHQAVDALNRLTEMFGPVAIRELQTKGKLSDQDIIDSQSYQSKPATVFDNINSHWNDKIFQQTYPEIVSDAGTYKAQADVQMQTITSITERERENNKLMNSYFETAPVKDMDKTFLKSLITPQGDIRTREEFYDQWKAYLPKKKMDESYDKYIEKYQEMFNSSPAVGGKQILKPILSYPGMQGVGGTGSRTISGTVNVESKDNKPAKLLRALPLDEISGISTKLSPTSEDKVLEPGTPEYERYMDIVKSYITTLSDKKAKYANGVRVDVSPRSHGGDKQAVSIEFTPQFFAKYNDTHKKAESSKLGVKYDDYKNVTLLFDKDKASGIFDHFKYGPTEMLLNQGKTVTINPYPEVGKVTMRKNTRGMIELSWDYQVMNDDGKLQRIKGSSEAHSGAQGIYDTSLQILNEAYKRNKLQNLSPYYHGEIKTLDQALQAL